jgi:protein-L-isoaspartate(D-aspartate) O-methyltransferase
LPSPDDRVLDIGTGSGYQAALLALLAAEVVTVERIPELAANAARTLGDLGYDNVTVHLAGREAGLA